MFLKVFLTKIMQKNFFKCFHVNGTNKQTDYFKSCFDMDMLLFENKQMIERKIIIFQK
jgi:hypothetical protein